MTNRKTTRRALVLSLLSLLVCCSMLVGTTFAWFTDSVQSGKNQIVAGNLDIELEYSKTMADGSWKDVEGQTDLVNPNALWEPGHTEVVYLRLTNAGTLVLKYNFGITVANSVIGKSVLGNDIELAKYLKYGLIEEVTVEFADRDEAREEAEAVAKDLAAYSDNGVMNPGDTRTVALVVYMPEEVGNEANYRGEDIPVIEMGVTVFATQKDVETDSFGPDYDEMAPELTVEVTPANIQEYLDGQHGDLANTTLQLTAGDYGVLYLGRPTKYAGSNTMYTCDTHAFSTEDAEAFKAHLAETGYHTTPQYDTTLQKLTIRGTEGAKVAGVLATSGHIYGDVNDYVLDKDYDSGSAYYSTLTMKTVAFKNVAFTGKVDINTSDADTVYDGISFDGCSFTTGGTASSNGAALRYYNEANNGKVRNLTVKNSTFTNVYQGVYVHHVGGVTITDNTFDTTGHNAIALQNHAGAIDLKKVVISSNTFKNIGDRVIRFGDIGADSNITMEYNIATNSGDDAGEAIKATTIAAGVKVTANYNSWGGTVVNLELCDVKTAELVTDASGLSEALAAGGTVVLANDIVMTGSVSLSNANFVLDGNGKTITMADGATNTYALLDITGGTATVKNVTFDGIKGGAIIRTVDAKLNVDNITAQNGNHTQQQGLLRLLGESTITNSTFKNNTCNMVITMGFDTNSDTDPAVVKNCVFENNTCNDTAVVYYAHGTALTADGNKFLSNTVSTAGNGAALYVGFMENAVITNNVFDGNAVTTTGTSKRVAGALMIGYEAVITGNSFVNNTVTGANAKGNDVCASVYYTDIDLSGNYWGGGAPVENDDYFVEYPDENSVIINDYLTTYGN